MGRSRRRVRNASSRSASGRSQNSRSERSMSSAERVVTLLMTTVCLLVDREREPALRTGRELDELAFAAHVAVLAGAAGDGEGLLARRGVRELECDVAV